MGCHRYRYDLVQSARPVADSVDFYVVEGRFTTVFATEKERRAEDMAARQAGHRGPRPESDHEDAVWQLAVTVFNAAVPESTPGVSSDERGEGTFALYHDAKFGVWHTDEDGTPTVLWVKFRRTPHQALARARAQIRARGRFNMHRMSPAPPWRAVSCTPRSRARPRSSRARRSIRTSRGSPDRPRRDDDPEPEPVGRRLLAGAR